MNMENSEPLHTADGDVKLYIHSGKQSDSSHNG